MGIIISVKNYDADLKRQVRKYYANANMLLRKFSYCSPDVKYCMFKSYCSTMYCSSMWFDSTVTAMRKLKIAYNNGLRRICHYLVRYGSGGVIFSTHNYYNNYICVWEWTSFLVQYILLYFICNSMYVVCMWCVSSILLLYLLDLESVNKFFK